MDFDEILPDIGEYGRYQKLMLCFVLLPGILPCGFHAYNQLFMSLVPEHWCAVPELLRLNLTSDVRRMLSVPQVSTRTSGTFFNRCLVYAVNYTQLLLSEFGTELYYSTEMTVLSVGHKAENINEVTTMTVPGVKSWSERTLKLPWIVNSSWPTVACQHGWEYQLDGQDSSVVADWNLVCERNILVPLSLAAFAAGGLLGNYIFGLFQEWLGRRPCFFIFLMVLSTFGTATAFANNYRAWLLLRFLNGLAVPAIMATPYILAIELVGQSKRTLVTVITNIAYSLTLVLLSIVIFLVREWHQLAMATTIPFVAFFLYWWVLPESPRWLLAHGKFEKVEKNVRMIAHVNRRMLPPDYMITLKRRFQVEYSFKDRDAMCRKQHHMSDLFRSPKMCRKTLIITYLWFVTTCVYVGLTYYAVTLPGDGRLNFLVSSVAELFSYVVLWPSLENWGRRCTLILSLIVSGVSCLGTSAIVKNQMQLLALYAVGKLSVSVAFVTLPVLASELYPVVVRGMGLRFSSVVSMVGSIIVPFFNHLGANDVALPLLIMGCALLLGGLMAAFLPETLHQRVPQTLQDGEKMESDLSCFHCCPLKQNDVSGSYHQGDDEDDLTFISEDRGESPLRSLLEHQAILQNFADSEANDDVDLIILRRPQFDINKSVTPTSSFRRTGSRTSTFKPIVSTTTTTMTMMQQPPQLPSPPMSSTGRVSYKVKGNQCYIQT